MTMEMNELFVLIYAFIIIGMAILLLSSYRIEKTVIAGNINKWCLFKTITSSPRKQFLDIEGISVDVSEMMSLIVCGDSMHRYGITDGDIVYIKEIGKTDKNSITEYPVIVLDNKHRKNDYFSHYKLRKFVGYVEDVNDANKIFETYQNRIHLSQKKFIEDMENSRKRLNKTDNGKVIVSETFDTGLQRNRYSLHHAGNIIGFAEYKS